MKPGCPMSFQPGTWIRGTPYRVVRPLGVGGMGEVYEVDHTRTGTRRAIKVVRAITSWKDTTMAQRLLREGRILRSIDHPNVVRVFEVGILEDERPYFAMELLEGRTLRQVVKESVPLPLQQAIPIVVQALDGLQAIHESGIVHRDIKPGNIFVDQWGRVKVLDLGIAKSMGTSATGPRTKEGMVIGTTRYMAPEQLFGITVDKRADLYSLSLVFLELLVGRTLGKRLDSTQMLETVCRYLPPAIQNLLHRALSIDPSARPANAAEMADEMRAVVAVPALPIQIRNPLSTLVNHETQGDITTTRLQFHPPVPQAQKLRFFWRVPIGIAIISTIMATAWIVWLVTSLPKWEKTHGTTKSMETETMSLVNPWP